MPVWPYFVSATVKPLRLFPVLPWSALSKSGGPSYRDAARALFDVRLTNRSIDAELARAKSQLAECVAANPDVAAQTLAAPQAAKPPSPGHDWVVSRFSSRASSLLAIKPALTVLEPLDSFLRPITSHDPLTVNPLTSAIVAAAVRGSRTVPDFRRFVLALAAFAALPPLLLAAFVVAVDPAYVFGSPDWPGINGVRPYYEARVLVAKPYQVWRQRPSAVALGSSRVEVGIDPRHPGWIDSNAFNFAMPSNNSYAVMLAFLHAQRAGAPLRQAVVGLDFFGYNINFDLGSEFFEARLASGINDQFARFLSERPAEQAKPSASAVPANPSSTKSPAWDEALYLAVNPDVAAAVARKEFASGRDHYERVGRTQRREGGSVPADWDEIGYLQVNPDVAAAISGRWFLGGYHHYLVAGRAEHRLGGFQPAGWNEERYLATNPDARNRLAQGTYRTGYLHYVAIGRYEGLVGGLPPEDIFEGLRARWPVLNGTLFKLGELIRLVLSRTSARDAVGTVLRQSAPAAFDRSGRRIWVGHDEAVRRLGGPGGLFRGILAAGHWYPTLSPPTLTYCFTNPSTGVSTFDSYRFMLRRAYAEGTDLQLYVTPLHAAMRALFVAIGLGERYEFWLRELVRINEQEAVHAGRQPLPLWDFSDPNTITREPIPPGGRRFPDAMVLGVLALPQGNRRSPPRSHLRLRRSVAPTAAGFRRAPDRSQHRCPSRRQQVQARGLGPRRSRTGVTDRRGRPTAELAEPPGRGFLPLGAEQPRCGTCRPPPTLRICFVHSAGYEGLR